MKNMKRSLGLSVLTLSVIMGFQNCGKVNFTAVPATNLSQNPNGTLSTTPCTLQNTTTNVNLKVIFMVDNSGSTDTTDPKKAVRITAVQDFINDYSSVPSFQYGYGYFAGTTAPVFDDTTKKFSTTPHTPFGSISSFSDALTTYESIATASGTPYGAAFAGLGNTIATDQALGNASSWTYAVVFMSDGMPTDLSGNVQQDIIALVDTLRGGIHGGGSPSTISSVYFGPESDSGSIANLQTMATEGQGQFVDTNKTTTLNFNQVITVAGTNCPTN